MTRTNRRRRFALLVAIHLAAAGGMAAPAAAMQILDAADHAEIEAEVSATGVNRIALHGDRIARVIRSPDGFAVEHDAASGDLYLRPSAPAASGGVAGDPVTLFVGTEKGFTYRLTLTPAVRDSAQILIRNAQALTGRRPLSRHPPRALRTLRRWCAWCGRSRGGSRCPATRSSQRPAARLAG